MRTVFSMSGSFGQNILPCHRTWCNKCLTGRKTHKATEVDNTQLFSTIASGWFCLTTILLYPISGVPKPGCCFFFFCSLRGALLRSLCRFSLFRALLCSLALRSSALICAHLRLSAFDRVCRGGGCGRKGFPWFVLICSKNNKSEQIGRKRNKSEHIGRKRNKSEQIGAFPKTRRKSQKIGRKRGNRNKSLWPSSADPKLGAPSLERPHLGASERRSAGAH